VTTSIFEDDKGYGEGVTPAADAGAAGSAAAEDPQPEPKKGRYGFDVRGSFGSPSAAFAAIPQTPQPAAAAVTVPKSAEQKAREEAKATVDAWALTPGVDMPFMGAGSSGFDLLGFWDSVDLGAGTEGAKAVACASFGWKASADGPERIFSSAKLWSTALKNRYSVWMVELMVFLKKNKAFLPTTAEAVAEVARRKKAKRAAKARARAATKASKAAEAAEAAAADSGGGSSSADLAGEVLDEEVEDELPLEDCDPLIFSEDEVASLLDSIAEFRGGGVDEDAEEAFLAFARDVAGDEASDAFAFDGMDAF